ncbi:isochorismatase family protein [Streptomyces sp. P17]|uniref:isochorismatase family protein n=1 Tax=Streptomyces sp. P17 TaxID=3074716 RepID=UPI0028F3FE44|nr:isochorismatase family protein [Streptomyces sp. P17]MDT9701310.1 isochorismatase family protein [Streptomyces sp. P17]
MPGIPPITDYPMPTADQLPANTAHWTVDPARAVLLVHDMQRYFLRAFPEGGCRDTLVANAARLRRRCAGLGVPVAYTAQPGGMTEQERGLLKDFWGSGMTVRPEDRQVHERLAPADGDWTLVKWRYSAFFRSGLLERLRAEGRDQLVLCGVYAHVGVLVTAIEAYSHDIQTFLAADAVADFSAEHHQQALHYAAGRCAMVRTTDDLLAELGGTLAAHAGHADRGSAW